MYNLPIWIDVSRTDIGPFLRLQLSSLYALDGLVVDHTYLWDGPYEGGIVATGMAAGLWMRQREVAR